MIKLIYRLLFLLVAGLWSFTVASADQTTARIDLEQETRKEVVIAVPEFKLKGGLKDLEGLRGEAGSILDNDLKLSELFVLLSPAIYKDLGKTKLREERVAHRFWNQIGAQWLITTDFALKSGGKIIEITFRLYDNVNERFLLGKRYTFEKNNLRRVIHRFADEVVMQLTGKRGVAETKIIFLSKDNEHREIHVIDFDGSGRKQLTHDRTISLNPAWSPDGNWIVYTSYGANNPDLVIIDSIGKGIKKPILRLPGLNAAPAWAPVKPQRIAMVLSKDQNSEIYILEKRRQLTRLTRHFNIDTSPTWSPDGKKIAFTSDRSGTGAPQIYVMDARKGDEGGVKRVSFGSSYNDNPAWSPDGDKIAFTSRVGKKFQIRIYDLNTQKTEQFTTGRGENEQPTWSPDGRFIAYRHTERGGTSQIYIKRLGSEKIRQLTFISGGASSGAWSPYPKR